VLYLALEYEVDMISEIATERGKREKWQDIPLVVQEADDTLLFFACFSERRWDEAMKVTSGWESKWGRTYRHRKRCSVFLEEVEILQVHESDSELKGKGGKGLDRERGMMETL
jgi:hypothetical protein